ncbi:hypothetical protein [Marinobacterium arenosum]|uniref:hypothetical protein n=1 Tax=Marinobacterium arenosum TaxID=2862496 RepID=UPI001C979651|nr:hypothetical protein [Marinobacterium arenosum]MBY4675506.1 hypothetical protein [Marinobacterium arenosum]
MQVKTLAIGLGKSVFQFHGVDAHHRTVRQRQVRRAKLLATVLRLAPERVIMEACGSLKT